jgi:hypothetical protein
MHVPTLSLLLCLLITAFSPAQGQTVYYVDGARAYAGTGSSWENALNNVSAAIDRAQPGDEIWVAQGVYVPRGTEPSASFQLKDGVALYGGFVGLEVRREDRDPSRYCTVLSGDRNGDDAAGRFDDNVYHVVTAENVGAETILDGVTIQHGRAALGATNAYGAGILLRAASPVIRRTIVRENRAVASGGGIAMLEGSAPHLIEVAVIENVGGGIYVNASRPIIERSVLTGNRATQTGGGIMNDNNSHTLLIGSVLDRNVATDGNGGGMATIDSRATVIGSAFRGNMAPKGNGGALLNQRSTVGVLSSSFVANATGRGGGGAFASTRSDVDIVNSVVTDNQAASVAGGTLSYGSMVDMQNTIVWANRARNHPLQMVRWQHGDVFVGASLVENSGGSGEAYWDERIGQDMANNMENNPRFLDIPMPGPDRVWGTPDDQYGDLRLADVSPALDAGHDDVLAILFSDLKDELGGLVASSCLLDMMDQPRQKNARIDVGAAEGTPRLRLPVSQGEHIRADSLGVRIAFRQLSAPGTIQVTHHPVLRRGPDSPDQQLQLPTTTTLASASRWTLTMEEEPEAMSVQVCFLGAVSAASARVSGSTLNVFKRRSTGQGSWVPQPTSVDREGDQVVVCAEDQTEFSEYVLVRKAPPRRVRPVAVADYARTLSPRRMESLALAGPLGGPLGEGTSRAFGLRSVMLESVGETAVRYTLAEDARVRLRLYDVSGETVEYVLINGTQTAGPKEVRLGTSDYRPGTYLLQLNASGRSASHLIELSEPTP